MELAKQHIVLSLIRSGRYELNHETGEIISNIGHEPRVLKPIKHYTGYLQYGLDIGFKQKIMVYGQGFSYLAKWLSTYDPKFVIDHKDGNKSNNLPSNLRCITEKENNNAPGNKRGSKIRRVRLPRGTKLQIIEEAAAGVSFVKLAERYGTTRQTVSKICSEVK